MGNNNQIDYAFKVKAGEKIKLHEYDPNFTSGLNKEDAAAHFAKYSAKLEELQELLIASGSHSVLVVLQGMDTSGKDGTIRHVMSTLNPQGCRVISFKVPTANEMAHDFLWRIHLETPQKGVIGIFNRSHYEDVLVVPVHGLKSEEVVEKNYEHINNFERLLADSGTIILKFFLHISKKEQLARLKERELNPSKRWKMAVGDYKERELWDNYQSYYEEALNRCSTAHAPWWIVPANAKWYRNLAVAETLVEQLKPYRDKWKKALDERGQAAIKELQAARARGEINNNHS
jgi:PPK2 family polyphosphate:nucleotide phosphotransferase